jgi:hypothetical protein
MRSGIHPTFKRRLRTVTSLPAPQLEGYLVYNLMLMPCSTCHLVLLISLFGLVREAHHHLVLDGLNDCNEHCPRLAHL